MRRREFSRQLKTWLLYGTVFFVFLAPVLRLVLMSFKGPSGYGLQNFSALLDDRRTVEAIINTIVIALLSTAVATFLGSVLAFLMAYVDLRHKKPLEMLILMPFIVPSYIVTLSWSGLLARRGAINSFLVRLGMPALNMYSMTGIVLVMGIVSMPVVYFNVVHTLRKIPADLNWAARACGCTPWQTLFRINLRESMPAVLSGSLLAFLAAIDNFAVPAFLGIPSGITVLSTLIYEKAIGFGPDAFPTAAALSVILSVLAIGGTLLESGLISKQGALESIREDFQPRLQLNGHCRRRLESCLFLLLGGLNFVPLANMVLNAFLKNYGLAATRANLSLQNFLFVFSNQGVIAAIRNSLLLAVIATAFCLAAGTALAYLKIRRNNGAAVMAERCAAMTYALPGIVLALAEIFHWTEPLPHVRPGIYGSISILAIAYVTRLMVLQIKGSCNAILGINPELEDAVRASGRSPFTMWRQVLIPLLIRPALASSALIFVSSLTELTLSSILAGAGTKTIGLTIFNFQQAGDYNLAVAMSTVVVALLLGIYLIADLERVKEEERAAYESVPRAYQPQFRQYAGAKRR
ncbi:MAG: ABC transporter permease [Pyramidobacter sp.]|jgi:iron(III) transport system permease protein